MRTPRLPTLALLALFTLACGEGFHNEPLLRTEVRGRVVGADPDVATISVLAADNADPGTALLTTGVEADGSFVVVGAPPTRVTLYIVGSPSQAVFLPVDVLPAEVTNVGDVVLQSAASLTVRVRDGSGNPKPGAEVDVDPSPFGRQTTDTQGTALFGPIAPACYRVRVRAEGFEDAQVDRCVSTNEAVVVDVTLVPKP